MSILIGIAYVLFCHFNPKTEYCASKWALATIIVSALLAYHVYLIAGVPFALLLFYLAASSTYYGMYPFQKHFTNNPAFKNIGLMRESNKTLVAIIIFMVAFIYIDIKFINYFLEAAPFVLLLAATMTFFPIKRTYEVNSGPKEIKTWWFTGNTGTGATFMSLLSMVCLIDPHLWTYPIILLAFIAIIKTRTSSGLGGIVAGLSVYGLYFSIPITMLAIIIFIGLILYLDKVHYGKKLLYLSSRDSLIKDSYKFLYKKERKIFGIGVGTYSFAFPFKQLMAGQVHIAVWMHSDILQFFLEAGVIGALLLIFTAIGVSPVIFLTPALAAFAACLFVNSSTNFPNHMSDTVFLLVMVLKYAYN